VIRWEPRGRVFPAPDVAREWIGGYAAAPFAADIGSGRARVFFSGRDPRNRAQIGACTIDLATLTVDAASVTPEPLVAAGEPGTFDESGCTMSCIVRDGAQWLLYYTGWMRGRTVPFYLAVGLAVSDDDGRTFRRHSAAPLVDRCDVDPLLTASPSVLIDGGLWRMWYISGVAWNAAAAGMRPSYLVKYAESKDGIRWKRDGRIAIPFASPDEYAIGRPHVLRDGNTYRMWFCVRGERYRIACAESADGLSWTRCDPAAPRPDEWDAEMQCYPMVLPDRGRWVMFYNGNGYGATGFGCATAERGA
jgi:hypothetical protein